MVRKPFPESDNPFYVLLRARDHIILDRTIPLEERLRSVDTIDDLTLRVLRQCPLLLSNQS